ncbi:MAG: DUF4153 domain-containing protein [Paracoccaceae bacterium]
MDQTTRLRALMAGIGALAGVSLYLLGRVLEEHLLGDRPALALTAFAAVFFTGLLAMAGPLPIRRASINAAFTALITSLLLAWASLRFDSIDGLLNSPIPVLSTLILTVVPLPFLIAAAGSGWRDYPALFTHAWTIVVRYASAWLFVGVVWAVIFLSDTLLEIVGLSIIGTLIDIPIVPWIVTGLTLGLALAVVTELSDLVSPYLILRLLRLLLPVVLIVVVIFIVALPFKGLSGLFGTLSAATTLLIMAATAATLVTTAIDQSDAEATSSHLMGRATQALALIVPIPALLGAYSIWVRVSEYGWTPDRVFAALVAALAIGYGAFYASAVLRGDGWMTRIRQGNISMALALIIVAAALLTPILNPERIATNSQLARFHDGRTLVANLDVENLRQWGRAGARALTALENQAKQPGQEALALRLQNSPAEFSAQDIGEVTASLRAILPVQPATASALRDRLLDAAEPSDRTYWLSVCQDRLPDGRPGCVMVVGDLLVNAPGDEAILVMRDTSGRIFTQGLAERGGTIAFPSSHDFLPENIEGDAAIAMIMALQDAAPRITPAPLNQIEVLGHGFVLYP